MLPKEHRLVKMKDYEILFAEGRFVAGTFLTLKVWKIDVHKYPRRKYNETDLKIGFLVSKKVSKRAVDRNKIKRQLREIVRQLLRDGHLQTGLMVAVIAKPEILEKTYQEIEKEIIPMLRRARVMRPLII